MENDDANFCSYSGLPSPMAYMEEVVELLPGLNNAAIDRIIENCRTKHASKRINGINRFNVIYRGLFLTTIYLNANE